MIFFSAKNNAKEFIDKKVKLYSQPPYWVKKLPNRLTYLRIFCVPGVVYLMSLSQEVPTSDYFWQVKDTIPSKTDIAAALLFAIAAGTDFFDGWIARKFHVETVLGKLLDPLADKLLVVSALIILVEKHRLSGIIAVTMIFRDLGINVIRLSAFEEQIQIPSNFIGKTKTALQDFGIIGLILSGTLWYIPFHIIGQLFMLLAVLASLLSGTQYLIRYGRELKKRLN